MIFKLVMQKTYTKLDIQYSSLHAFQYNLHISLLNLAKMNYIETRANYYSDTISS